MRSPVDGLALTLLACLLMGQGIRPASCRAIKRQRRFPIL